MRLVLDENLPHDLKPLLVGHDVFTIADLGWKGIENGKLLSRAASEAFDVLVTLDRGFANQQNLNELPVAVILVRARSNELDVLKPLVPKILRALNDLKPRRLVWVPDAPPTSSPSPATP